MVCTYLVIISKDILIHYLFLQKCDGDLPVHRDFHTATSVGDMMVIFRGRSTDQSSYHNLGRDFYSNKVIQTLMELFD